MVGKWCGLVFVIAADNLDSIYFYFRLITYMFKVAILLLYIDIAFIPAFIMSKCPRFLLLAVSFCMINFSHLILVIIIEMKIALFGNSKRV